MRLIDHLVLPLPPVPGRRSAPSGMDIIEHELVNGLPGRIALAGDLTLVMAAPTGALKVWMDLPPNTTIYDSSDEARPVDPAAPGPSAAEAVPLRLYLMRDATLVAAAPVRLGKRMLLPESGPPLVELVVLSAVVTAGAVRGLPLSGAKIRLAWRRPGRPAGDPPRGEPLPPAPAPPPIARRAALTEATTVRRRRA